MRERLAQETGTKDIRLTIEDYENVPSPSRHPLIGANFRDRARHFRESEIGQRFQPTHEGGAAKGVAHVTSGRLNASVA